MILQTTDIEYITRHITQNNKIVMYRKNKEGQKFYIEITPRIAPFCVCDYVYTDMESFYVELVIHASDEFTPHQTTVNLVLLGEEDAKYHSKGVTISIEQVFGGFDEAFLDFDPVIKEELTNIISYNKFF